MKNWFFLFAVVLMVLTSCTDNSRARNWGGTEEVELQPNHELLGITWKDSEMWILTKDTLTGINYFKEKSAWGVMEGTVIVKPNEKTN